MISSMTTLFRERNQFMKTETDAIRAGTPRDSRQNMSPAPSLRVPVTANNRAFLRWLRAAESKAWEAGLACKCIDGATQPAPISNLNNPTPNSTHQPI
jgi:hypothetical protein